MKVGIDATFLGNHAGLGSYVRPLVRTLSTVDPDGDYTLFLSPPFPNERALAGAECMQRVALSTRNGLLRNAVTLPLALARHRIDVFHVQYLAPPLCPARAVVTIHDLIHEYHPEFYPPQFVTRFRAIVPLTVRRAAAVLTVSEYSKRDIVRRYNVPPEKVTVAHGGPDPMYRQIRDAAVVAGVRERYGTGERFILYVGNIERRKNLKTLIDAYVRLRRADAARAKLVLVGSEGWIHDDAFAAARESGYAEELVFTGYVPDEDLVALFNAATVFVYPSLFEGLGLPPLEAMACGTPVVCSNTSSLPEVVGDAALMVGPLDTEGLAAALARVLADDGLRGQLRARGLERVVGWSWERAARTIARVYREAAGRNQV